MPFPIEYATATKDFYSFMEDVKEKSGLHSFHVTYTMVQSVFQVFRRRIRFEEALAFSNTLPVALRALFVKDWDIHEPQKTFESFETMNEEVKELRYPHNFSIDNAIEIVASVLPKHVETIYFSKMMETLPPKAQEFWGFKAEG
jgi:uncharacterized protein (DUF2267 family)